MDEERQNPHDDSDADDSEKLYELYVKEEEDLSKRDLSNVENLDKAILSLSSAGLGLSLVFIKNVVELSKANHVWVLNGSWLMFVLAITSTLLSYLFGQRALNKQREFNEKYYLEGDEDAGQQTSRLHHVMTTCSELCFCLYLYHCCFWYSSIHWVKFGKYPYQVDKLYGQGREFFLI